MTDKIENWIHVISRAVSWVAVLGMIVMLASVFVDVVTRYIRHPIRGNMDIVEILMVVIIYLALAANQQSKGNIRVNILYSRFSERYQGVSDAITLLPCICVFSLIFWGMLKRAIAEFTTTGPHTISALLQIPLAPFFIVLAFGCLLLVLEMLIDIFHAVKQVKERKRDIPASSEL